MSFHDKGETVLGTSCSKSSLINGSHKHSPSSHRRHRLDDKKSIIDSYVGNVKIDIETKGRCQLFSLCRFVHAVMLLISYSLDTVGAPGPKFELTNQASACGKSSTVLTSNACN